LTRGTASEEITFTWVNLGKLHQGARCDLLGIEYACMPTNIATIGLDGYRIMIEGQSDTPACLYESERETTSACK
jgi:hypothetical protein